MEFREQRSHGISRLEGFDFEVVMSTPETLVYSCSHLPAKQLSLLKVVCRQNRMPWSPLF
jgi:hypothetical protein